MTEKATHLLKDLCTLANVKINFYFYEYFHFGLLLSLLEYNNVLCTWNRRNYDSLTYISTFRF